MSTEKDIAAMPHPYITASQYIFSQWQDSDNLSLAFSAAGTAASLVSWITAIVNARKRPARHKKYYQYYIGAVLIFSFVILTTSVSFNHYRQHKRIKANCAFTIGNITEKEWRGRSWYIRYSFTVNGVTYSSDRYEAFEKIELQHAKPGYRYRVIYNNKDPRESVIDLHAPEKPSSFLSYNKRQSGYHSFAPGSPAVV